MCSPALWVVLGWPLNLEVSDRAFADGLACWEQERAFKTEENRQSGQIRTRQPKQAHRMKWN